MNVIVRKGNQVQLSTFRGWSTGSTIAYESKNLDGKELVVRIWCTLCARYSDKLLKNVKGQALKDLDSYISGTNYVTKHTVLRHLSSKVHELSVKYDQESGMSSMGNGDSDISMSSSARPTGNSSRQPCIDTAIHKSSKEAYHKLLKSAYLLAVDGQPLSSFKTIVNAQKANGVPLITGTDNSDKAREFIHVIADVMREKLSNILESVHAFSVLSDGSQARKTGSEKELVMVRVVRDGQPVFYCVSLQDVDEFGDANAEVLKRCIDSVFTDKVKILDENYKKSMVCATADGAAVNTGIYNGLLTRLTNDDRPWLIKIHCVLHRVELSIGDSLMKNQDFVGVKDFMIMIFYLFKQSGKLKRHFQNMANVLGVQVYTFPKVHGTRFVNHQRRGLGHLLNNWIVLIQTLECCIATAPMKGIAPKLQGILKKLRNFTFLSICCLYKKILDIISQLSLTLEKANLLAFEVKPAVEKAILMIDELREEETPQLINLAATEELQFTLDVNEDHSLSCKLAKTGHMKRAMHNREYISVSSGGITSFNNATQTIQNMKQKVLPGMANALKQRFSSFDTEIYRHMQWLDPANWRNDSESELLSMNVIAEHFATTLEHANFDQSKCKSEWRDLKLTVSTYYKGMKKRPLWKRIFQFRQKEFPNICLLAEVIMSIGASNGNVEAGFSLLTVMLSDRRLKMNHGTMEDLLLIKANHYAWSDVERTDLISSALEKYMSSKRRKHQMTSKDDAINALGVRCRKPKRKLDESDSDTPAGGIVEVDSASDNDGEPYMLESDSSDHDDMFDDEYEEEASMLLEGIGQMEGNGTVM